MQNLNDILIAHGRRYPLMQPQDAVKLIYQNEFGPAHLIADQEEALSLAKAEYDEVAEKPGTVAEDIGGGFCRLNFGPAKSAGLPGELVGRLFLATSRSKSGSMTTFEDKLGRLSALAASGAMPFSNEELAQFLDDYYANDCPAQSHSVEYRNAYCPSYRVIRSEYAKFLNVLKDIFDLSQKRKTIVAIDGRCASGKSRLAGHMRDIFGCAVVSMDDFFLPGGLRTSARLSAPGGNIHYERFAAEVLPGLRSGREFEYRAFDCRTNDFAHEPVVVPDTQVVVVEGSYSRHPEIAGIYDYKIFMTCSPEIQKQRLFDRNGEKLLLRYLKEWIPMEEAYFDRFGIVKSSDAIIDTSAERG